MRKGNLPKFFGGLTVMLTVFMGLFLIARFDSMVNGAKHIYDSTANYRTATLISQPSRVVSPPNNIIEGFFDSSRDGDLTETEIVDGKKVTRHYRAIQSDQIRASGKEIVLKLEIYDNNKKSWIATSVTKINKEDGTVYFLLKTEEDSGVVPNNYYTGTYQLIIE